MNSKSGMRLSVSGQMKGERNMQKQTFVALALSVILSAACLAAEDREAARKITVSGTAVTQTVPDLIVWSISTLDESKNLIEAKDTSDRKLKSILALMGELGVKPEDIQTGYVNIRREYNQDEHGRQLDFKCFSVRRGVTVKQRDLKRFDEYLTKLVSSAEMEVNFNFDSSRMTDLRWDTRLKALKIAKDKAEAMAKVVDAKVGKVLSIEEPAPSSGGFGNAYASNGAFFSQANMKELQGVQPADVAQGTFAPGSMEIKVTVTAVFELE
jgi:uncharacterized protein